MSNTELAELQTSHKLACEVIATQTKAVRNLNDKLNEMSHLVMRLNEIDMGDCHHVDSEPLEAIVELATGYLIDTDAVK